MDHDFLVAEPRRKKPPARHPGFSVLFALARFVRRLAAYPNHVAGAVLVALAAAIAVNALELQTARHPAPFFSRSAPLAAAAPAPVVVKPQMPPQVVPQMPPRVVRMQAATPAATDPLGQFLRQDETSAVPAPAPQPSRRPDPISQILRATTSTAAPTPRPSRTVMAAQRALMKLGYVLQPDGLEGEATRKVILQYEASHHLPQRGELTAKLIRTMSREANIAIP